MTENNLETTTTPRENENSSSEHRSHHHHSHHGHSHHSHSHHSSSHHSSSGHRHSNHSKSTKTSGSNKGFSLAHLLRNTSLNTMYTSVPQYRKISRRILFCILLFGFIFGAITGIIYLEETPTASKPGYARSESDQLRSQITTLQLEKANLEKELDEYKKIYGELDSARTNEKN